MDADKAALINNIADKLRILSVQCTSDNPAGNSGHPTTCASCAEVMAMLFFHTMRYDKVNRRDPNSDRMILSKGHAAPILYSVWVLIEDFLANGKKLNLRETGASQFELINNLRRTAHKYEGHPTPKLDFVDVATGSLGQGLGVGCGMAYMGKYADKADYKTYVLLGDGETAEGSVYEAMAFASYYKLNNLVALVDLNRLGQSQPTMYQHDTELVAGRWRAFGWETLVIDGHDIHALDKAFNHPSGDKPLAIVCQTYKGKGFEGIENELNWHGKPLSNPKKFINALVEKLPNEPIAMPEGGKPSTGIRAGRPATVALKQPVIPEGTTKMSCRKAYGAALIALNDEHVFAFDAEVKNSTFAIDYMKVRPDNFVECFIAEQNLAGVTIGAACRDRAITFASTFAAFFARAYDHIRMGAISLTNANFVGSHAGVSIGSDGPSQMALEDLAMFRAVPHATVLYPSDAVSTTHAVEIVANRRGIGYIRTTREDTPVIYKNSDKFEAGKSIVLRQSDKDQVAVFAAGITLFEALKAHDELAKQGINIRVIDVFSLKPLDADTISRSAQAAGGKVITVEDHYPQGGIGEAVAGVLVNQAGVQQKILAVNEIPTSGGGHDLLKLYHIDSTAIIAAVKAF